MVVELDPYKVAQELRRQDHLAETDSYLNELVEDVGEPSPGDVRYAEQLVREIVDRKPGSRAPDAIRSVILKHSGPGGFGPT